MYTACDHHTLPPSLLARASHMIYEQLKNLDHAESLNVSPDFICFHGWPFALCAQAASQHRGTTGPL